MSDSKEGRYFSVLYAVLLKAREIGEREPGSDEACACYQILDAGLQEAEIWEVPLSDLGLEGFDPAILLKKTINQIENP